MLQTGQYRYHCEVPRVRRVQQAHERDLPESRTAADEAGAPSPGAPKEISLKPQGLDGAPKAPGAPAAPKAPGAPKPPAN